MSTSTDLGKPDKVHAGYMSFELIYNYVAARIVAYGRADPLHAREVDLRLRNGRRAGQFVISQCSWFIHVMPAMPR